MDPFCCPKVALLTFSGTESKALGVHVQLGPVAGPLGKIPVAGRNWEGM
jgi:beta-glucosidase